MPLLSEFSARKQQKSRKCSDLQINVQLEQSLNFDPEKVDWGILCMSLDINNKESRLQIQGPR